MADTPDTERLHTRPMSPCISICTMAEDGHCMGCRRTVEEIRHWAKLTPEQQWALIDELGSRPSHEHYK